MNSRYIDAKTFSDFKCNEEKLINILNHNMTVVRVDVSWLKIYNKWMIGLLTAIFLSTLGALIL